MSIPEPVIKRLEHLGLIAAFCNEAGLPRMIDAIIPKYAEHTVSHGEAFLAMILNGLGFHSRTLHMFSGFFRHKPIERLMGPPVLTQSTSMTMSPAVHWMLYMRLAYRRFIRCLLSRLLIN